MNNVRKLEDIEEEITKVSEESTQPIEDVNITFVDFFEHFDLFQYTIATLIGVTSANIIREIIKDLIFPIIKKLLFENIQDTAIIYGIEFEVKDILSNLLFLIIFIILLYIIVKYVVVILFRKVIDRKREKEHKNNLVELYKIKLMKDNNELLREMNSNFRSI